jgi:replicative DNA helicase
VTQPAPFQGEKKIKTPPNSKESEMMVLGCMLTSVNAVNVAADTLDPLDFYYTEHQIIFEILKAAYLADKPVDIHLTAEDLKRKSKLDAVGGISYLTSLAQYVGTSAYIEEYVDLVREKSILRRMITAAQTIERTALEDPRDVGVALDEAQSFFYQISQSSQNQLGVSLKELLSGVKAESKMPFLKELQERQQKFQEKGPGQLGITGVPTHFVDLDKMLNGFMNSNLILLGARPAMGKTAIAINIAENICFRNKVPVGIFSLEMSASQILGRMVCSQAEVEMQKMQTGALNGSEYQRIVGAVNAMQKHTMIIDDQPGLKITDLRARARRMKEVHGIGFIAIDYLQLLSGSGNHRSQESRQIEISEISRMLKTLARELNIPILCCAQLSRKVEERQGHRPMMSDLRESGCLAGHTKIQDAITGQVYTIRELAERAVQTPIRVWGADTRHNLGVHLLTKAFYSGKKKIYELKTLTQRSIIASGNHPFLQRNKWTPLEALKKGERVAVTSAPNPAHFEELFEEAYVGAYKVGKREERISIPHPVLYWDEIISIEEVGEEDVYDATVPGVHNFIANDFIVHNSLEQDSDVVMFLFRRDYYDKHDKPGLAELIVSKNRHGGVGDVTLAFRKEFGQFANYTPIQGGGVEVGKGNREAFASFSPQGEEG